MVTTEGNTVIQVRSSCSCMFARNFDYHYLRRSQPRSKPSTYPEKVLLGLVGNGWEWGLLELSLPSGNLT